MAAKTMTDFQGTEIKVGDRVAYIRKGGCGSANMCIGVITEIKGCRAYVDTSYGWGVERTSIYKLKEADGQG